MSVVSGFCLVLDGCRVDGNTSGLLLRCFVDLTVGVELRLALLSQIFRNSGGQSGLPVVDMSYWSLERAYQLCPR